MGSGRRLSTSSSSRANTAGTTASAVAPDLQTMTVRDFLGVFIFWLAATVGILLVKVLAVAYTRRQLANDRKIRHAKQGADSDARSRGRRQSRLGSLSESGLFAIDSLFKVGENHGSAESLRSIGVPSTLDINNPSAMLRYLIIETKRQQEQHMHMLRTQAQGSRKVNEVQVVQERASGNAFADTDMTTRGFRRQASLPHVLGVRWRRDAEAPSRESRAQ